MQTEVLISGAGPSGLALACQLERYGIKYIILDTKEGLTPFSKAIGVQARTLEVYEQIGLASKLISLGNISEKAQLIEGGEIKGEVELSKIGEGLSQYPYLLAVDQSLHEQVLYDHLRSVSTEKLRWGANLVDFEQDNDKVTAHVRLSQSSDETTTITARYLVGCDGARSLVRHQLGLKFEGSTFTRLFYVADVLLEWNFGHKSLALCLSHSSLTAFFPLPGSENRFRIVGVFPEGYENEKDEKDIVFPEIERKIKEDSKIDIVVSKLNWFAVYRVHSRRVERFYSGRCFLVGDSAHIHSPAGGQGMNTGIQDGYNLAWKLAMVLRHQNSESAAVTLFESYDEERSANAKRLLETTDKMFDLGASPDWTYSFLRTYVVPYVAGYILKLPIFKQTIFPIISQIGVNYCGMKLSRQDVAEIPVKSGERFPYFSVNGKSVFDKIRAPKFHAVVFSDGTIDEEALKEGVVQEKIDESLVDVIVVPLYPSVVEKFKRNKPFFVFLRPDNYIAFVSEQISATLISSYLLEVGLVGSLANQVD
eukprot:TRINITY_DN6246_c0_g1_i1.p1 TRINITY_DN6246_c0_g1~~TRINITY_DN6246_c0_g1_i1.p1  ORF type:complete len:549 (+),score=135.41 TRINITY_DN6246_c0_g1_i1:40-1647(+)